MQHMISTDDRAFLCAFEACEVSPNAFDHAAHVRLAYVLLCEHSADAAVIRMRDALLAFLAHLGVPSGKYHETITRAWILAVSHFMHESLACDSAAAFIAQNPRLLDTKIMLTHYSAEVLYSPKARETYVPPDVQPIPNH